MTAIRAFETEFLREFAVTYVSRISFDGGEIEDLQKLRDAGLIVGLPEILYVFKNGSVVSSEKEDADGCFWLVEGETCHGDNLAVAINVWCDHYRVRVLRVSLLGERNA